MTAGGKIKAMGIPKLYTEEAEGENKEALGGVFLGAKFIFSGGFRV